VMRPLNAREMTSRTMSNALTWAGHPEDAGVPANVYTASLYQ
jgi:hypothetical protein